MWGCRPHSIQAGPGRCGGGGPEAVPRGWAGEAAAIAGERGLPWRTAHQIVATLVRIAISEGKKPQEVTEEYLDRAAKEYQDYGKPLCLSTDTIQRAMNPREMVNRRTLVGGPAPVRVREQIAESNKLLLLDEARFEAKRKKLAEAADNLEKAIEDLINKIPGFHAPSHIEIK